MYELMVYLLPWLPYLITGLVLWIGAVIIVRLQKRTEERWGTFRAIANRDIDPGEVVYEGDIRERPHIMSSGTKMLITSACGDGRGADLDQITKLLSREAQRPISQSQALAIMEMLEGGKYIARNVATHPIRWVRTAWWRKAQENAKKHRAATQPPGLKLHA